MNIGVREAKSLTKGGVGVLPTDTLYGIVASALDEAAVERVYTLKGRTPAKPCIVLIASTDDLGLFGVALTDTQAGVAAKYWPGPVSIALPCGSGVGEYLHRGTHTLAFRIPKDEALREFLKIAGPLIAPSANPEGLPPATNLDEAKNYFGDRVDFYIDGGVRRGDPSTIITFGESGEVVVLRQGRVIVI